MAQGKRLAENKVQVAIYIEKELLQKIDKHWHKNEIISRNETIKQLLEKGLSIR